MWPLNKVTHGKQVPQYLTQNRNLSIIQKDPPHRRVYYKINCHVVTFIFKGIFKNLQQKLNANKLMFHWQKGDHKVTLSESKTPNSLVIINFI